MKRLFKLLFRHLNSVVFYLLMLTVVLLLAQLSERFNQHYDWTQNQRHSLSDPTLDVLEQLQDQVTVQVFIDKNHEFKPALDRLLKRYQRHGANLDIRWLAPSAHPQAVRDHNITRQGEMLLSRGEQTARVQDLSEESFTNALITVSRDKQPWIVFAEGHDERSPHSEAANGYGHFARQLKDKGFRIQSVNIARQGFIPDNTGLLVIADSRRQWLPAELDTVRRYLREGGQLLWLHEPDADNSLVSLAADLQLKFSDSMVMNPGSDLLDLDAPQFLMIGDYANHPVTAAADNITLMPTAAAIEAELQQVDWIVTELLRSNKSSWLQGNDREASKRFTTGIVMEKIHEDDHRQRVAVLGDSDFLSNAYLGYANNLQLGMSLVNWLVVDDHLLSIPITHTADKQLQLSDRQAIIIGSVFLFGLPLLLIVTGFFISWRRHRR